MKNQDIVVKKGSQFTIKYQAFAVNLEGDRVAYDLTDKDVRGTIKPSYDSCKAFPLTCVITDALQGLITIYLPASVSAQMAAVQHVYDVEIYTPGTPSEVDTALYGNVTVIPEVTTAVA